MSPAGHGADPPSEVHLAGRQADGPHVAAEPDRPAEVEERDVVMLPAVDVLGVQDDPVHQQVLVRHVSVVVEVKLADADYQTVPAAREGKDELYGVCSLDVLECPVEID